MNLATLSSKYQLCIPKAIREELHLKSGQQFVIVIKNHSLELIPRRRLEDFKGSFTGANPENYRDREDET